MKAAVVVMAREALKVAAAVPVVREQEVAGEQKWSHTIGLVMREGGSAPRRYESERER